MSFLRKIFGGASFDDERAEADKLFDARSYVDARQAYARALENKKGASPDAIEHCRAREGACRDHIAEERIREAEELASGGQLDLAEEELRHAMEIAASEAIAKRAERRIQTLEQEDAKVRAEPEQDELSDEDRWAILSGTWEEAQLEEYDGYGEPFREALLALHDGEVATAHETLEEILEETEEPLYLWLEVGRARVAAEQWEEAEEALREFLDSVGDDEAGEARLGAYALLARLRHRDDDEDGAVAELEAAMEAFPDDPRPFFLMGQFLRSKGHGEEAAEVLEAGRVLLDEDRFDWRYYEETGLAHKDAGDAELAAEYLDRVIAFFVDRRRVDGTLDYPPETAVARAELYEEEGRLDKAADIFRTMAEGADRANHLRYHREAGRLLEALGLREDAQRMWTRALALAEGDEEVTSELEALLAKL